MDSNIFPNYLLPAGIFKLFEVSIGTSNSSSEAPVSDAHRYPRGPRRSQSLFHSSPSLSEVRSATRKGAIDHIQLDKKTGRGWMTPKGAAIAIPFHFPPAESLKVMADLKGEGAGVEVTFVNKMDFVGDFRSMGPKALIGIGLLLTIRATLAGIVNVVDGVKLPIRPSTSNPIPRQSQQHRGPSTLQNAWARSRLKAVPTTMKGAVAKKVTFEDVAGLEQAKNELSELVYFLKEPKRYHDMGARIPRGCLLSGPPGTGKTLLAKAVAGEAEVPFFSLSGSDFMEVYVGVGAARVRELFAEARNTPAGGIIFIDEIDAIGRKRNGSGGHGGSDERENTLNQLLIEMDGFAQNQNVVVVAASNRCDILDNALTRPGRFDRTIECELPSVLDRQSIISCHMENVKLDLSDEGPHNVRPFEEYGGHYHSMERGELSARETWCNRIAALTPGFSGADLSNVVNEAAILAARNKRRGILLIDLEESVERTMMGLEKGGELPSKERLRKTAFHEAGHAIVGWILENAEPPIKLSIVPRKSGVLGYAQHMPSEGSLDTRDMILDRLAVLMGGRIAEEAVYGQGSTGAEDDLAKASSLARAFVSSWAFASDEAGLQTVYSKNLNEYSQRSDELMKKTDAAVENILHEAQNRARDLIESNYEAFNRLAIGLIEKETLGYGDMILLIGQPPRGELSEQFRHYLKHELGEVTVDVLPPLKITTEEGVQ